MQRVAFFDEDRSDENRLVINGRRTVRDSRRAVVSKPEGDPRPYPGSRRRFVETMPDQSEHQNGIPSLMEDQQRSKKSRPPPRWSQSGNMHLPRWENATRGEGPFPRSNSSLSSVVETTVIHQNQRGEEEIDYDYQDPTEEDVDSFGFQRQ
eukprot:Trichotokara_eunicae@DN3343_c0_g1_i1.p1